MDNRNARQILTVHGSYNKKTKQQAQLDILAQQLRIDYPQYPGKARKFELIAKRLKTVKIEKLFSRG